MLVVGYKRNCAGCRNLDVLDDEGACLKGGNLAASEILGPSGGAGIGGTMSALC